MSVFMIVVLIAAASAMTMIGPRVYAAMARDGYLPSVFAGKDDEPPLWSVLLQGAIALAVAMTTDFIKAIQTVGTVLTLMAALTVLGVFKLQFSKAYKEKPGIVGADRRGDLHRAGVLDAVLRVHEPDPQHRHVPRHRQACPRRWSGSCSSRWSARSTRRGSRCVTPAARR